jgi:uncharacterized delta-60 repeat protein
MKKITTYITLLFTLFCSTTLSAQTAGTLDSTFATNGVYTTDFGFHENVNDIKVQPDQKIIWTGVALTPAFAGVLKVLRLKADGTPDSSFATNGVYSLLIGNETYGYESCVQSDGKIIVAGITYDANYNADWLLLRLNSTGTLDTTFGTNGITMVDFFTNDDLAQALTIQPDGKILVSGTSTDTINYYNDPTIVRFTENGIIDSTFGVNGVVIFPSLHIDNELTSIAIQANGKIIASGHYSPVFTGATDFDILLICLDSNGLPDPNFGNNGMVTTSVNGGIDDCFGMKLDSAENIFVAGFTTLPFTQTLDMILMKYNSTGTLDPGFGNNGLVTFNNADEDVAMDLVIQNDNKIVLCGSSGLSFFGPRSFALWRYLPNGTPDNSFGNNGFVTTAVSSTFQDFNAMDLQADGKIVAGGRLNNIVSNNNDAAVLRYYNDMPTTINELTNSSAVSVYPNPVLQKQIITLHFENKINSKMQVSILDVLGNKLSACNVNPNQNSLSFQLPVNIGGGIYFVMTDDGKNQHIQKLIVQ